MRRRDSKKMSKEQLLKDGHEFETKIEAFLQEFREWLARLEAL